MCMRVINEVTNIRWLGRVWLLPRITGKIKKKHIYEEVRSGVMSFDVTVHRFLVTPGDFYERRRILIREIHLKRNVVIIRTIEYSRDSVFQPCNRTYINLCSDQYMSASIVHKYLKYLSYWKISNIIICICDIQIYIQDKISMCIKFTIKEILPKMPRVITDE